MSRFSQITHAKDNPELEAAYLQSSEMGWSDPASGIPCNWITSQSARPDLIQANLNYVHSVADRGQLPPTVKQLLLMALSMQNDCRYCSVASTSVLEKMGVPRDIIESCASDPDMANVPPPQRAILKFGLKVARNAKSITNEDVETLRDFNFSDGEIMEVAMVAAVGNLLNTWAEVSGIEVEQEAPTA